MREIQEETGLHVRVGKPFHVDEWRPVVRGEEWHIVATFFECHTESQEVILGEDHVSFEWIDPNNHKDYQLIENLYPAFEAFLNR